MKLNLSVFPLLPMPLVLYLRKPLSSQMLWRFYPMLSFCFTILLFCMYVTYSFEVRFLYLVIDKDPPLFFGMWISSCSSIIKSEILNSNDYCRTIDFIFQFCQSLFIYFDGLLLGAWIFIIVIYSCYINI